MQNVKEISFKNVKFNNGFWKVRTDLNRNVSVNNVYERFEETGRMDALRFNYEEGKKPPLHIFFDSDVAKWIESVGYLVESDPDSCSKEQAIIDEIVEQMKKNQYENGVAKQKMGELTINEMIEYLSDIFAAISELESFTYTP